MQNGIRIHFLITWEYVQHGIEKKAGLMSCRGEPTSTDFLREGSIRVKEHSQIIHAKKY
jgi:hypothetical protein